MTTCPGNPVLILPAPPSANRMYTRTRQGRVAKATPYKAWLSNHAFVSREQLGTFLPQTPVQIEILANINRQRDLDNLIKPTLDLLQYAQVINDDRYVDYISAWRYTDITVLKKGYIQVALDYVLN